jgi:hypothetical protein
MGASDDWFSIFIRTKIVPYVANFALNLDVVKKAIFPLASQIGINYRESSLSVGDALKIKAGDRMPYFTVEGKSVYDLLREPTFHLLVFADGTVPISEFTGDLGGRYDFHCFPLFPNIAEIFGSSATFTVLLRPDNYIGYIAEGYSIDDVKSYLARV